MSDDINDTTPRGDIGDFPDEMPEQFGGVRTTLMPGINAFKLPEQLATLWHDIKMKDGRKLLANGQPNPTFEKDVVRRQLKLDRNAPLVVVGGAHDGEPMTANIATNPRPRGKKDDPKTAWVSDAAYLLRISLADPFSPKNVEELEARINQHSGKTIRLEHGLTGQCRADKVRYIAVVLDGEEQTILDPSGKKGCNKRFYTKDFLDKVTGKYATEVECTCGDNVSEEDQAQGHTPQTVVIRGFENIERYLPPLGQ